MGDIIGEPRKGGAELCAMVRRRKRRNRGEGGGGGRGAEKHCPRWEK